MGCQPRDRPTARLLAQLPVAVPGQRRAVGKAVGDGDQLDELPGRRELHDLTGEGCAVDHVFQGVGGVHVVHVDALRHRSGLRHQGKCPSCSLNNLRPRGIIYVPFVRALAELVQQGLQYLVQRIQSLNLCRIA